MRTIYRVRFKEPPQSGDERTEFFFTSLAAIYEVFTAEQIGCRVNRLIAEECDPYEVYCYEYNNHECGISWDGDLGAISLIVDYWGANVAHTIRRRSAQYSIESIR